MKSISKLLVLFSLSGCTLWSNAFLGDNYYYLDKYESIDVGYPNQEAIIYKSPERNLFKNVVIAGDVVEVTFNNKFILAKQIPIIQDMGVDSINFYLINKITDQVYGPYDADSITKLKETLDVKLDL